MIIGHFEGEYFAITTHFWEFSIGRCDLSRNGHEPCHHWDSPVQSLKNLPLRPHHSPLTTQKMAGRLRLRKLPSASVPHAEGTSEVSPRKPLVPVGLEEKKRPSNVLGLFWAICLEVTKQRLGKSATFGKWCFLFVNLWKIIGIAFRSPIWLEGKRYTKHYTEAHMVFHDLGPQKVAFGKGNPRLFQGNLGW